MSDSTVIKVYAPDPAEPNTVPRVLPVAGIEIDLGVGGPESAALHSLVSVLEPGSGLAAPARAGNDATDAVPPDAAEDILMSLARLTAFDPAADVFNRVTLLNAQVGTDSESLNPITGIASSLDTVARLALHTGANAYRAGAGATSGTINPAGLEVVPALVTEPGEWSQAHAPAAATAATTTRAGVANVRHVCKSITVSIAAVAAQGAINVVLRDGATGVGAILWQAVLIAAAGTSDRITLSGLNIAGSAGNAMTLETTAAPAATNFAVVSLSGYDTPNT